MARLSLARGSAIAVASGAPPELTTAAIQRRQRIQLAVLTTLVVLGSLVMAAMVFCFQVVSVGHAC